MKRSDDPHRYDDIINLPHPTSVKHSRMTVENRAAQFSPFAALTGYEAIVEETARLTEERAELDEQRKAVLDGKLQRLRERLGDEPKVSIVYFRPDLLKFGGEYVSHSGRLRRIDPIERSILFADGLRVAIDDIAEIENSDFE